MNLVLFDYATLHILRIMRVLRMSRGHCLLIGVGGSGRQSLSRLSVYIMQQKFVEPTHSKSYSYDNWSDDMKEMLGNSGCDHKTTTFFLSDACLKYEFMLEDTNSLLNAGEIPNLYNNEEKVMLVDRIKSGKKHDIPLTNEMEPVYDWFVEKCRTHLHVILAMSPTGNLLNERIRNYTALVNCCTIDKFFAWPNEALQAVASQFLKENFFDESLERNLVDICIEFHTNAT